MAYEERYLRTHPPLDTGDRSMKCYHVNVDDREIEPEIAEAAYAYLPKLLPDPTEDNPPTGWIVLHRGRDAAYLTTYSWVWGNVIECRGAAAASEFLGCPDDNPANFVTLEQRWIGCVWELPPLEHERGAWIRHMLAPDVPDVFAYLADQLPAGVIPGGAQ